LNQTKRLSVLDQMLDMFDITYVGALSQKNFWRE